MPNGSENALLGAWGESVAGAYLREHRYKLVGVNFRCRGGELDIIAEKGRYIAFVEVKLRRDAAFAEAREFVTKTKQQRVITAAEMWLAKHPTRLQPRFDVIEIYAPEGYRTEKPTINHIKDAFEL